MLGTETCLCTLQWIKSTTCFLLAERADCCSQIFWGCWALEYGRAFVMPDEALWLKLKAGRRNSSSENDTIANCRKQTFSSKWMFCLLKVEYCGSKTFMFLPYKLLFTNYYSTEMKQKRHVMIDCLWSKLRQLTWQSPRISHLWHGAPTEGFFSQRPLVLRGG